VPLAGMVETRQPGDWEGQAWVAGDFDEPSPPDTLAGFEGED
jgi:hypothetical protein